MGGDNGGVCRKQSKTGSVEALRGGSTQREQNLNKPETEWFQVEGEARDGDDREGREKSKHESVISCLEG